MPKDFSPILVENVATVQDRLLTTRDAAAYLALHPNTLYAWRNQGIGPLWVKLSFPGTGVQVMRPSHGKGERRLQRGAVRYRLSALNAFIDLMTVDDRRLKADPRRRVSKRLAYARDSVHFRRGEAAAGAP